MIGPLTLSGALTMQDPKGNEHRLVGAGSAVVLHLHSLGSVSALAQIAPGRRARAAAMERLSRGLEMADLTLDIRLWRRTAAQLLPGSRAGLVGRLLGLGRIQLTPLLFLRGVAGDGAD